MHPPPHHGHHGQSQSATTTLCYNLAHNLTQMMIGGVVVSALIIPYIVGFSSSYGQHIILCTLGYFILMTQAVLVFSPYGWASHMQYEQKRIIHATMQVLGSVLVIAGSVVRMANVTSNFSAGHGICGFIAMVLASCTLIGGLLSFIIPKIMNQRIMKTLHVCAGALTLCFAFITIILAFHNYYRNTVGDRNANSAVVISIFAAIGTILALSSIKNIQRICN